MNSCLHVHLHGRPHLIQVQEVTEHFWPLWGIRTYFQFHKPLFYNSWVVVTDGECCPWALCPRMEPWSNETEPKKLRILLSGMWTTNWLQFLYSRTGTRSEMIIINRVLVALKSIILLNLESWWAETKKWRVQDES